MLGFQDNPVFDEAACGGRFVACSGKVFAACSGKVFAHRLAQLRGERAVAVLATRPKASASSGGTRALM